MKTRDNNNEIPGHIIATIQTLLQPFAKGEITPEAINRLCQDGGDQKQVNRPDKDDELLTLDEACKLLKCSRPTLYKYHEAGYIKIIKPFSKMGKTYVSKNSINFDKEEGER